VTTYSIEPGDWECATGESIDRDVVVRKVDESDITVSLLIDLGFDETQGKPDCLEIEAEWGYLQVWMWQSGPEWFVCGESLGDDGPKNADDVRQFMRILGFKDSSR
jgi:hypothetical protein